MRAGVPVVPITVVGSEEAMPIVARAPRLAKLLRVPYVPLTANMLVSGRWASSPTSRPSSCCGSWTRSSSTCRPTRSGTRAAGCSRKRRPFASDMQASLYDMLRHRRSVWFG